MEYDTTELRGLGCLGERVGPVADAEARASEVFGSERVWFLVNGSSAGVHAAVLATCRPGDTLVVARNAHRSAIAAMVLAGANADVFIPADRAWAEAILDVLPNASSVGDLAGNRLVVVGGPDVDGLTASR